MAVEKDPSLASRVGSSGASTSVVGPKLGELPDKHKKPAWLRQRGAQVRLFTRPSRAQARRSTVIDSLRGCAGGPL
jgi:hypothetical protein